MVNKCLKGWGPLESHREGRDYDLKISGITGKLLIPTEGGVKCSERCGRTTLPHGFSGEGVRAGEEPLLTAAIELMRSM